MDKKEHLSEEKELFGTAAVIDFVLSFISFLVWSWDALFYWFTLIPLISIFLAFVLLEIVHRRT
ncbi:MAG: hypothetical protein AB1664_16240 [Thermodesulfobacteriota bacterium]